MNIDKINIWRGATVLCLIEDQILFILRSKTMPTHKSQIAFPGGGKLSTELDPKETAYREVSEELGLKNKDLEFVGYLPPVFAGLNYLVIPSVVKIRKTLKEFTTELRSFFCSEWDEAFLISYKELCKNNRWSFAQRHGERTTKLLFCSPKVQEIHQIKKNNPQLIEDCVVWGATARILYNFIKLTS